MVKSLGLAADEPPVILPPAPCHSFSGEHAGARVHLVCFGEHGKLLLHDRPRVERRASLCPMCFIYSKAPYNKRAGKDAHAAWCALPAASQLHICISRCRSGVGDVSTAYGWQGLGVPGHATSARPGRPSVGKCKATGVDNVGTVPAALTAYLAIQAFKPDIVISTGERLLAL